MTVAGLCKRVSSRGFTLLEQGFALDARPHAVSDVRGRVKAVSWVHDSSTSLMIPSLPKVDDYLGLVRSQNYSFLMQDGAAVQILYQYDGAQITRHRLLYWPCPFDAVEVFDYEIPVIDVFETLFLENVRTEAILRGLLRFDFAPDDAGELHPPSHLTLAAPDCRVPVHAPLSFDTFMRFLLENFYPQAWMDKKVKAHLAFAQETNCLRVEDNQRVHLAWQYG